MAGGGHGLREMAYHWSRRRGSYQHIMYIGTGGERRKMETRDE